MKLGLQLRSHKKSRKPKRTAVLVVLLLAIVVFVLPNVLLAPKLKSQLERKLNKQGTVRGSIGALIINPLNVTLSLRGVDLTVWEDDFSVSTSVPSVSVRSQVIPLLSGEIVPRALVVSKPVVVINEPALPAPQNTVQAEYPHVAQASMGDGLLRVLIEAQTRTWRKKALEDLRVEKAILKDGKITYRSAAKRGTVYEMEIDRVSILLEDIVLDDRAELRSLILQSLKGYWSGGSVPGFEYSGALDTVEDAYQGRLTGKITDFPLDQVREPVEEELGAVIHSGTIDLDSVARVHGTLLDSTHTLVVHSLDVSMEKSLGRNSKLDVGSLVVEILKVIGNEDTIAVEDIRLQADLTREDVWSEMAEDALEAILTKLAQRMLRSLRDGGEKSRDRLKQLGESLLDAWE